jgi:hypothetical protein
MTYNVDSLAGMVHMLSFCSLSVTAEGEVIIRTVNKKLEMFPSIIIIIIIILTPLYYLYSFRHPIAFSDLVFFSSSSLCLQATYQRFFLATFFELFGELLNICDPKKTRRD